MRHSSIQMLALAVCLALSLPPGGESAAVTVTLAPEVGTNQTETIAATTSAVQGRSAALTSGATSAENVHEKRSISLIMPLLGSIAGSIMSSLGGGGGGGGGGGSEGFSNGAAGLGGGLIGMLGSLLSSRMGLGGNNFNFNSRPISDDGIFGSASSQDAYNAGGYSGNSFGGGHGHSSYGGGGGGGGGGGYGAPSSYGGGNSYGGGSPPGMDFSLDLGKLSSNLMNGFRLGKAAGSAGGRFLGNILTSAGGVLQNIQPAGQQSYGQHAPASSPPKAEVYQGTAPATYHQPPPPLQQQPSAIYGYSPEMPPPFLYGSDHKPTAPVVFPADNYLYEGRTAAGKETDDGGAVFPARTPIRYNDYDSDTRGKLRQQFRQQAAEIKGQDQYQTVAATSAPYVVTRGGEYSDSNGEQQQHQQRQYRVQSSASRPSSGYETSAASQQVASQSQYGGPEYEGADQQASGTDAASSDDGDVFEPGETQMYEQVLPPGFDSVYNLAAVSGLHPDGDFYGERLAFVNQQSDFSDHDE